MVDPHEEVLYVQPSGSQYLDKFCLEKAFHEKKMVTKIYRTLSLYDILVDKYSIKMFKNKVNVSNN